VKLFEGSLKDVIKTTEKLVKVADSNYKDSQKLIKEAKKTFENSKKAYDTDQSAANKTAMDAAAADYNLAVYAEGVAKGALESANASLKNQR
jgi:hypothetical protein